MLMTQKMVGGNKRTYALEVPILQFGPELKE